MNIWFTLLYQPLVNGLILFYKLLGHNLGLAIIAMTIFIRLLLLPLTLPALKASKKMKELKPELDKLKKKHKENPQKFSQAQLELYKKHGVNPVSGCLPQIVRIVLLIALFQAFRQTLQVDGDVVSKLNDILYPALKLVKDTSINTKFLYLELTKPDKLSDLINLPNSGVFVWMKEYLPGPILIGASISQFLYSKKMMGQATVAEQEAKKTKEAEDDMAAAMQKQMLYMMPVMTLLVGLNFPSGLVLYWLSFSLVMVIQQLIMEARKNGGND